MDLAGARWRTSSFSSNDGNNGCVEVALLDGDTVAVRDTKDRTRAPHLHTTAQWQAFLTGIRANEFDPT